MSWTLSASSTNDDWVVTRLRGFLTRRKRTGRPDLPLLSVNLPDGVVLRQAGDGRPAPSKDLSRYQEVRPGDLVMNQLGKPHGALGVSRLHGIISPAYFVAEIGPVAYPRFIHHLLRTRLYISEYERRGKFMPPSQFDISWHQFRTIPVSLPPIEEQRAIADYLDSETSRIDTLNTKKRRMIELLEESDRRTIDDLFQGVSQHGLVRLGYLAEVRSGLTLGGAKTRSQARVTLPYLRVANVKHDRLDLTEVKSVTVDAATARRTALRNGDVLMTEGGDIDKLGRGTVWRGEIDPCLHQNHVFAVRMRTSNLLPEFLALLTRTSYARQYFEMTGVRSTNLASTSSSKVADFRIPLPGRSTQSHLVSTYQRKWDALEQTRVAMAKQLDLLNERRQALITAAVTGELPVPHSTT